jgi:hypothetical protein
MESYSELLGIGSFEAPDFGTNSGNVKSRGNGLGTRQPVMFIVPYLPQPLNGGADDDNMLLVTGHHSKLVSDMPNTVFDEQVHLDLLYISTNAD